MPTETLSSYINKSQIPFDAKLYAKTLAELAELGTNSNKAFTYYEDMPVNCVENHTTYVWREELTVGETGGILENGTYVYPAGVVANGIIYGERKFNFFIDSVNTETIKDTEDIRSESIGLFFADKDKTSNSLGRKHIRSDFDFTTIPTGYNDSIWEIKDYFDLEDNTITLPANVTFNPNGGKFANGTIVGNNTKINNDLLQLFDSQTVTLTGSWVSAFTPYMFGAKGSFTADDTLAIQKCINTSASVGGVMSLIGNFLSDTLTFGDGVLGTSTDEVNIKTLCKIQSINDVDMIVVRGTVKHTGSLELRGINRTGTSRNIVIKEGAKDSTFDKIYLSNTALGIDYEAIGNNNIINWNSVECRELSKTYRAGYTKGAQVSNTNLFNIGEITTTEPLFTKIGHIVIRGKAYPIVAKPNVANTYYVGDFYNMPDWDSTEENKLWHYTGGGVLHQKHTDNGAIEYKTISMLSLDGASFTTQSFYGVTINGGNIEGNATNVVVGGIFMDGVNPTTMTCIRNTFTGIHTEANVANQPTVYTTAKSNAVFNGCLMANGIRVSSAEAGVKFHSWRGTDRTSNVYLGTLTDFGTVTPSNPDFFIYRDLSVATTVQVDLNNLAPDMEYMGDLRVDYAVKSEINLLNIPAGEVRTITINAGGVEAPCTINGGYQSIITVKGKVGETIIKVILLMKGNDFTHYIEKQGSVGYLVSTLPTGVEGQKEYVTDATTPTYLGTLTGGGAVKCPVFYNGTIWISA
jgi:hypothetical protein